MAGHTPGPWYCTPEADLHRIGVYTGKDEKTIICDVSDEDLEEDLECEANARLIATAPDLLAACQAILNDLDGESVMIVSIKSVDQVRAAIARATDEETR